MSQAEKFSLVMSMCREFKLTPRERMHAVRHAGALHRAGLPLEQAFTVALEHMFVAPTRHIPAFRLP